ncbi:hypothetical protein, partial [Pseudomonas sp. MPR-AND1A]|uniref:hypothetical protein n=1 Tax=Pseudomonas sp. MPR-AND1A TaxID=2070600 RepID=UPI001C44C87E
VSAVFLTVSAAALTVSAAMGVSPVRRGRYKIQVAGRRRVLYAAPQHERQGYFCASHKISQSSDLATETARLALRRYALGLSFASRLFTLDKE